MLLEETGREGPPGGAQPLGEGEPPRCLETVRASSRRPAGALSRAGLHLPPLPLPPAMCEAAFPAAERMGGGPSS